MIAPYDVSLQKDVTRKEDRAKWGTKVIEELKKVANIEEDKFIILAGKNYVAPIENSLPKLELPLKGKGIGQMLKFLNEKINK